MDKANYSVVEINEKFIVLKDVGPWSDFKTITNAPEKVIAELCAEEMLKDQKVIYFDSENELGELKHDGRGHFRGFAPVANYPFVMEDDVCGD